MKKMHRNCSDWQDQINRLQWETFRIDTLGSLKPTRLNKKRSEDMLESAENSDTVTLVMPLSEEKKTIWL